MYVCMYACMYMHVYACMHDFARMYESVYTCVYMNVCRPICMYVCTQGHQSWGLGLRPPDFGQGGCRRRRGGRERVVKYYSILSCTGNMFESGDFEEKYNNLPRSSCK